MVLVTELKFLVNEVQVMSLFKNFFAQKLARIIRGYCGALINC